MFENDLKLGFTLIELLVVIAIIGILSSVVLASLSGARKSGQIATMQQQVRAIEQAATQYQIANNSWPSDEGAGQAPDFVPEYLSNWPDAPGCLVYDFEKHTVYGDSDVDVGVTVSKESDSQDIVAHRCFTEICRGHSTPAFSELNTFSCN